MEMNENVWNSMSDEEKKAHLEEKSDVFEALFDEERAQLVNDLETVKLYASKVRDLFVRAYGLADWMWGHVPVKHIPIEYGKQMNEIYEAMQELGIEVEKWER